MKKGLFLVLLLLSALVACGNHLDNNSSEDMADHNADESFDFGSEMTEENSAKDNTESEENTENNDLTNADRKIIYTADLQIEVTDYQKSFNNIEDQVEKLNGYIVETNMHEDEENETKYGQITARIPQKDFQKFIKLVEDASSVGKFHLRPGRHRRIR